MRLFIISTFCLVAVFLTKGLSAQYTISGKVYSAESGSPVAGATVNLLLENKKGTVTNDEGAFSFNVSTGKAVSISITAIGFQTKMVSDIELEKNAVTEINIVLERATQELKGVVVKTTARRETVASLYTQQKLSATISDGISADIIRRTPDKNTGDVLKRVSGTTIQDNKFVIVRGLSDRYNTALLDNAVLPSTEPNKKAFSFDIVPSNLVDRITISKTATPDLPGDFAGGAIQITTKDIPSRSFTTISIGEGYNTASTFKNFKSGTRNVSDWFAFDNGDKKLSGSFPASSVIINRQLTQAQMQQAMQKLPGDWNIYSNKALPTQSYQLSSGKTWIVKDNNKLGGTFALSYRNAQNILNDVIRKYYEYDYKDNIYKFQTSVGALLNLAYATPSTKISLKNIYNRVYDDQHLSRTGYNSATSSNVKFFAFDLIQKQLLKSTLEGNHKMGTGSKLDWTMSYANVMNDQPDQRKVNYLKGNDANEYSASITTLGKENTRMFTHLNENSYSATAAYSLPINMFDNDASFKAGVSSLYRKRIFDARFIGMVLNVNASGANEIRQRPLNTLFASDVLSAYTLDEIPNELDSYNANAMTNAAFVMLDNKIGNKSRIVWGVRAEQFSMDLKAKVPTVATTVNQDYIDILPSINYRYSISTKTNLRASYFRSVARPEFRELASTSFYDYELLASLQGNPNLKRAHIDNADLRFEYYPSAGQIISVSAFYKKFDNAIEAFNDDANSTRIVTYFNASKANAYGLEVELRKSLDFIINSDFMQNTMLYANFSLIKSTVENSDNGLNLLEKKRPMVGQAPYVVNTGLQHDFLNDKMSFNLLYNRLGRRLNIAAGALFPGVWEAPRDLVDMQISMKVLKKKGELKLNVSDILNQPFTFYYDMDKDKKYSNTKDETLNSYKAGSNISLTFSYTF